MIEIVVVHFNPGEYMRKDHIGSPGGKVWVLPTDVEPFDLLASNPDVLQLSFDQGTYGSTYDWLVMRQGVILWVLM